MPFYLLWYGLGAYYVMGICAGGYALYNLNQDSIKPINDIEMTELVKNEI